MFVTGTVPSSLCKIPSLQYIDIPSGDSNSLVTCAPLCLTTVTQRILPSTVLDTCPSFQDNALCGFIAATNIQNISGYSNWSCSVNGTTTSNPCVGWYGIYCNGNSVSSIWSSFAGLTGNV